MKKKLVLLMTILYVFLCSTVSFAEWRRDNYGYRYFDATYNQFVASNWLKDGSGYYFLDMNGYMVTGWYLINGKYYYFDQNGLMQTGFLSTNNSTYYLDVVTGQMVTGWIQTYDEGVVDYYYFDESGVMVTGWKNIGDKKYYFNEGKCIINMFAEINGTWYHFGNDGSVDTGWITANNKMYYFDANTGALRKGWIQDQNGYEYYLSDVDGSLLINTSIEIAGVNYTFDSLGRCVNKNVINVYNYNANNVAITNTGVNIGVSPGMSTLAGVTSFQNDILENEGLQAGITTGPK